MVFPVVAAVAAAVTVGTPAAAAPVPAADTPAIQLVTANPHTTYQRFPGDPIFFLDLGVHAMAGDRPFEIRASRASYNEPIVASRVTRQGNRETLTKLPAGLVTDLSGLTDFVHLRMTSASGDVLLDRDTTFCPNSFLAVRSRPDAPDTTPYPQQCASLQFAPFALGGVWGLPPGWSSQLVVDLFDQPIEAPDGDYTLTASIKPGYRSAFGIPANQAEATVAVTVQTMEFPEPSAAARASGGSAATPHRPVGPGSGYPLHLDGAAPVSARADRGGAGSPLQPARTRPAASTPVPPASTRPDLRPLPAFGISTEPAFGATGDTLSFAANVWNAGPSPLVVDGFRRPGTDVMDAVQYFYNSSGRQVGSAPTGTLEYDSREGHQHWHFTDFATYRLLDANQQLAVRSGKEAFCLAPTDPIDLLVRSAEWKPSSTGLATACGTASALAIREALPVGWGDTYVQALPGQAFDITGLPNGTYYIEVLVNPENRLYEASTANNSSRRKVIIGGTPGARTVQVPPVGLVDAP
jgi:hypothetical protein